MTIIANIKLLVNDIKKEFSREDLLKLQLWGNFIALFKV